MTEEPYRWLEAIGHRREYVREQLREGSPAFAARFDEGVLLFAVGQGNSKVFELHDRHALVALGHPADVERIRQTAIDAAHLEAFTRATEDVSLRRLVSFGLSIQLKQNFEQLFTAPVLAEFGLVELGTTPAEDLLVRLHFDGAFSAATGGALAVTSDPAREPGVVRWLEQSLAFPRGRLEAAAVLAEAWCRWTSGQGFESEPGPVSAAGPALREALAGRVVEAAWLDRSTLRPVRYHPLSAADLGLA